HPEQPAEPESRPRPPPARVQRLAGGGRRPRRPGRRGHRRTPLARRRRPRPRPPLQRPPPAPVRPPPPETDPPLPGPRRPLDEPGRQGRQGAAGLTDHRRNLRTNPRVCLNPRGGIVMRSAWKTLAVLVLAFGTVAAAVAARGGDDKEVKFADCP